MYAALRDAYTIPGPSNVSQLASVFEESKTKFAVCILTNLLFAFPVVDGDV
jgi:hypothetical protein